jgi:hypothetical protein
METIFGIPIILIIWWIYWASRSANDSVDFISEADNSYTQASNLNIEDQLSVFARLAREGHASALASYTWRCLEYGRHSDAVALYNETRTSLTKDAGNRLGWELANCDSNQALNLMATGTSLEDVRNLWERNINMNHNECLFYAKLAGVRDGKLWKSDIAKLPGGVKRDIKGTLNQGTTASGWYKNWCSDVLAEFGDVL